MLSKVANLLKPKKSNAQKAQEYLASIPQYPPYDEGMPVFDYRDICRTQTDLLSKIRDQLGYDLFDYYLKPVIHRYAQYVHLLPASENHHHRGAGGLFRHGLEASYYAVRRSLSVYYPIGNLPQQLKKEQQRRWMLAAAISGLIHDIGKSQSDMQVTDRTGQYVWNPQAESLAEFLVNKKVSKYFVSFRSNRQHKQHELFSQLLADRVIPSNVRAYLTEYDADVMVSLLTAVAGTHLDTNLLSEITLKSDQDSVKRDIERNPNVAGNISYPLERYILDALKTKVGKWLRNIESSPTGHAANAEGQLIINWQQASKEVKAYLKEQKIPSIPQDDHALAKILADRGYLRTTEINGEEIIYFEANVERGIMKVKWPRCIVWLDPSVLTDALPGCSESIKIIEQHEKSEAAVTEQAKTETPETNQQQAEEQQDVASSNPASESDVPDESNNGDDSAVKSIGTEAPLSLSDIQESLESKSSSSPAITQNTSKPSEYDISIDDEPEDKTSLPVPQEEKPENIFAQLNAGIDDMDDPFGDGDDTSGAKEVDNKAATSESQEPQADNAPTTVKRDDTSEPAADEAVDAKPAVQQSSASDVFALNSQVKKRPKKRKKAKKSVMTDNSRSEKAPKPENTVTEKVEPAQVPEEPTQAEDKKSVMTDAENGIRLIKEMMDRIRCHKEVLGGEICRIKDGRILVLQKAMDDMLTAELNEILACTEEIEPEDAHGQVGRVVIPAYTGELSKLLSDMVEQRNAELESKEVREEIREKRREERFKKRLKTTVMPRRKSEELSDNAKQAFYGAEEKKIVPRLADAPASDAKKASMFALSESNKASTESDLDPMAKPAMSAKAISSQIRQKLQKKSDSRAESNSGDTKEAETVKTKNTQNKPTIMVDSSHAGTELAGNKRGKPRGSGARKPEPIAAYMDETFEAPSKDLATTLNTAKGASQFELAKKIATLIESGQPSHLLGEVHDADGQLTTSTNTLQRILKENPAIKETSLKMALQIRHKITTNNRGQLIAPKRDKDDDASKKN